MTAHSDSPSHPPAFKAEVALAAISGQQTIVEVAERFGVNPQQVIDWRQQLSERAQDIFVEVFDDCQLTINSVQQELLREDALENAMSKAGFFELKW